MIWITCHGDTKSLGIEAIKKRFPEFLPGIKGKSPLTKLTTIYLLRRKILLLVTQSLPIFRGWILLVKHRTRCKEQIPAMPEFFRRNNF